MGWFEFSGFVGVAAAVLFLPGLLVSRCARLPWLTSLATAPALSTALVATAAILAQKGGVRWGPLPVVLLTVIASVGCLVISLVGSWTNRIREPSLTGDGRSPLNGGDDHGAVDRHGPDSSAREANRHGTRERRVPVWVWWAATTVGAIAVMADHMMTLLVRPDSISQTFDNLFHLNAIRWILDTGDGSSLNMTMTSGTGAPIFYPLAWHDIVSLVLILLRSSNVPAGNNALVVVVAALVWVPGCLYLARTVLKCNLPGIIAAGFFTSAFPSFPYRPLSWGVLYPNFLGIALLPVIIALTCQVFGLGRQRPVSLWRVIPVGLLAMLGTALAHPNTVAFYCVFLVPVLVTWTVDQVKRGRSEADRFRSIGAPAVLAAALLAVVAIWRLLRPIAAAASWLPDHTSPQALGEALAVAPTFPMIVWLPAAAVIVGAVVIVRFRGQFWILASHLLMVFLWMVIASWPWGTPRSTLTGIWYNDPNRIAAAFPLSAYPLAIIGVTWASRWALDRCPPLRLGGHRLTALGTELLTAVVAVVVLLVTTQFGYLRVAVGLGADTYRLTPTANLVSSDEYALIRRLPGLVEPGSTVATTPYDGSSMAFALENIRTTTTHPLYSPSPDVEAINLYLANAVYYPRVCQALSDLNVRYALSFGSQEVNGGDMAPQFPGFKDLSNARGFTEIARQGDAVLYRIDACQH